MPEEEAEFHQVSLVRHVEKSLRALWPLLLENPDYADIKHGEIWSSTQQLAELFEARHQVVKQARLDDDSIALYRFIGGNTLWLEDVELHVPFTTQEDDPEESEDDYSSELIMTVESPMLVRYIDIQPGATRDNNLDDYYHGPHLLCEFSVSQAIKMGDIQIPVGEHIGFIPFRKITINERHIPSLLN